MRFLAAFLLLVFLPFGNLDAETFTVKIETTEADGALTNSTSTVTIPKVTQLQSVDDAIADILASLGVDETLSKLWADFEIINDSIIEVLEVEPIDVVTLAVHAQALQELALHLQVYLLQQALRDLPREYGSTNDDTWLYDRIFNDY